MPHDTLELLCMWRHVRGIGRGHDYARVRHRCRITAVSTDDANDWRAERFCVLQSANEVRADVAFNASATDREHHNQVFGTESARPQRGLEDRGPALVVGARGPLRNVLC